MELQVPCAAALIILSLCVYWGKRAEQVSLEANVGLQIPEELELQALVIVSYLIWEVEPNLGSLEEQEILLIT